MKFKLFRDKKLIGSYESTIVTSKAREDALQQASQGKNPTYVISGQFAGGEHTRIGKLNPSRGRI